MNKLLPRHQWSQRPLRCIRLSGVFFVLLCLANLLFGCQNKQELCEVYVHKYNKCYRRAHQRAMRKYRALPKEQQARIKPMLDTLRHKIIDGERIEKAIQRCVKQPPAASRVRCLQKASCDHLSQCDPKRPS